MDEELVVGLLASLEEAQQTELNAIRESVVAARWRELEELEEEVAA